MLWLKSMIQPTINISILTSLMAAAPGITARVIWPSYMTAADNWWTHLTIKDKRMFKDSYS